MTRRLLMWLLRHLGVLAGSVAPQGHRVRALSATAVPGGVKVQLAYWCPAPDDVVLSASVDGLTGTPPAPVVYARHQGEGRQVEDVTVRGRCYEPGAMVAVSAFLGTGGASPLAFDVTTLRVQ